MEPTNPVNLWQLNVDQYITDHNCGQVTSHLIWEPSTTRLHPEGLYSEDIFGEIGSPSRIVRIGYIALNTRVFVPGVFKKVTDLKGYYQDVLAGKAYAKFDPKLKDIVLCSPETPGADTGFTFFMDVFPKLVFTKTKSYARNTKVDLVNKAREANVATTDKLLVLPAGLRDLRQEGDRYVTEDINKFYLGIMSLGNEVQSSDDPELSRLYDGVRYTIQLKCFELYKEHENFLDGKRGFVQRRYARRAIGWGTRNVCSVSNLRAASVDSPSYHKHDETVIPLFQAAKMFQPLVIHNLRQLFYGQVFDQGALNVPAINTKTFDTEYIEVAPDEITKAQSSEGMESLIQMFQNIHMRKRFVILKDIKGKHYYMFLVYQKDDEIYLLRDKRDFISFMKSQKNHDVDVNNIRPLTYAEMLYLATFRATERKFAQITRYPAIELGSTYPSRVKVASTVPSKQVKFSSQYKDDYFIILPHYPDLNSDFQDSLVLHDSRLKGLTADFDGDTISANAIMSDEAVQECEDYLNDPRSYINPNGKFLNSVATDLTEMVIYNLTRDPDK